MNPPDHARRPHACFTEPECSESGEIVPTATVLLTNRRCPWRCVYCDLWRNALDETVPRGAIPTQIEFALNQPSFAAARQIKLYNSGSFFDRAAIPPDDFPAIANLVRGFGRVIVECHPALVGEPALRFQSLLRAARAESALEVAMGLEIADDAILARLSKRMTMAMFARSAEFLRKNGIAVRVFVIVKPPFVRTDEKALEAARQSVMFAFDCGATVVSLIPARFGTEELDQLHAAGEFSPPRLGTLEAALEAGIAMGRGRVFADTWNLETLMNCQQCGAARLERLRQINLRQECPPPVECGCRGRA
jgi:radical SAM enzyme (TIGR01210 family)